VDILAFELDDRAYAFPADHIVQVVQMVAISPLPGSPAVVEGVVNVRGTLTPVFDLRTRLGLPPRPIDPGQHLVILRSADRQVAIRVDAATDFSSVPDGDVTTPATLAATGVGTVGTRHLAGAAATADGTLIIYDLRAFLSLDEAAALDDALAPAGG
jgi:purine-binding chemotaxis protein CheW